MRDAATRRFDDPDERRTFELGSFELVRIGGVAVGRPSTRLAGAGRST